MLDRRQFLQITAAAAAITGISGGLTPRALARQALTQKDLLKFDSMGQVRSEDVVEGKSVDLGGRRIIKKKKQQAH